MTKKLQLEDADMEALAVPPAVGKKPTYPWEEMKPGPKAAVFDTEEEFRKAIASARNYAKRHNQKFTGRKCIDGKYRIWRMK